VKELPENSRGHTAEWSVAADGAAARSMLAVRTVSPATGAGSGALAAGKMGAGRKAVARCKTGDINNKICNM